MDLYAHFPKYPSKDYAVSTGPTFKQNYNETLDSGTIRLDHITSKLTLQPYDDVIIYSGTLRKKSTLLDVIQGNNFTDAVTGDFYAHFLVGDITRQRVTASTSKAVYSYVMPLVSETKGLEKIVVPNVSITQPRNGKYFTIGEMLMRFINEYCPKIKRVNPADENHDLGNWSFSPKYQIKPSDPCWEGIWESECAEHSFNSGTLREILNFIVSVKDRIIVVHDWVIRCMDITERKNSLGNIEEDPQALPSSWVMSGSDFCDRTRTEYSDGLPSKTTAHYVEKLGFRNSDAAIMTLQNMRLEFSHPIYKINHIYMCYYRTNPPFPYIPDGVPIDAPQEVKDTVDEYTDRQYKTALVKRDITDLVLLNERRDLLSENWNDVNFMATKAPPFSVKDLANYRMCTVGYSIGDKYITGWGQTYSFQSGFFRGERSYLENLITFLEAIDYGNPLGNAQIGNDETWQAVEVAGDELGREAEAEVGRIIYRGNSSDDPVTNFFNAIGEWLDHMNAGSRIGSGRALLPTAYALRMKGIFFEVDYEGFIDGAVISSKDYHDGNIVSIDAQSQSLAIIESDGVAKKEKVNRLGNATSTIPMRHKSMSEIKNLGDYDDDDEIIYMSSITIYQDHIAASYYLCKDYVLKNYYTSVLSKLRPFPMASYNESVLRKENRTVEVLLSPNESYSHPNWLDMPFRAIEWDTSSFGGWAPMADLRLSGLLFSFNVMSDWDENNYQFKAKTSFNISATTYYENYVQNYYLVDTQCFNFGYSMCVNVTMDNNIKTKSWISRFKPNMYNSLNQKANAFFGNINQAEGYLDMLTGALQSYYMVPRDDYYQTENISFTSMAVDKDWLDDYFVPDENGDFATGATVDEIMEGTLLVYPKAPKTMLEHQDTFAITAPIGVKDQKEKVSMTMQFEPISTTDDIQFSEYMFLLSDLYDQMYKTKQDIAYIRESDYDLVIASGSVFDGSNWGPPVGIYVRPVILIYLKNDLEFEKTFEAGNRPTLRWEEPLLDNYGHPITTVIPEAPNLKLRVEIVSMRRNAEDVANHVITCDIIVHRTLNGSDWLSTALNGITLEDSNYKSGNNAFSFGTVYGNRTFGRIMLSLENPTTNIYNCRSTDIASSNVLIDSERRVTVKTINDRQAYQSYLPAGSVARYETIDSYTKNIAKFRIEEGSTTTGPITIKRSYYVFECPKMDKSVKYEKISVIPYYFVDITNEPNAIQITTGPNDEPQITLYHQYLGTVANDRSIRVYYYDEKDRLYHFVYGQNAYVSESTFFAYAYISFMDAREKTVYKADGDKYGKVYNHAEPPSDLPVVGYGNPTAFKVE